MEGQAHKLIILSVLTELILTQGASYSDRSVLPCVIEKRCTRLQDLRRGAQVVHARARARRRCRRGCSFGLRRHSPATASILPSPAGRVAVPVSRRRVFWVEVATKSTDRSRSWQPMDGVQVGESRGVDIEPFLACGLLVFVLNVGLGLDTFRSAVGG